MTQDPTRSSDIDTVLVYLIEDMPDYDPILFHHHQLLSEYSRVIALRDRLKTTSDPKGLLACINADGSLDWLFLASAHLLNAANTVTSISDATKLCIDEIDKFLKHHPLTSPRLRFGDQSGDKLFGMCTIRDTAQVSVALLEGKWYSSLIDQLGYAVGDNLHLAKPEAAAFASDLQAYASGISTALASLSLIATMTFPTSTLSAKAFIEQLIDLSHPLTEIGIYIDHTGMVSLKDLPDSMRGTPSDLGYDPTTLSMVKDALNMAHKHVGRRIAVIESSIAYFTAGRKRFVEYEVSDETEKAVKEAILIYKDVLSAGLRRVPKATVWAAKSAEHAMKAFYTP